MTEKWILICLNKITNKIGEKTILKLFNNKNITGRFLIKHLLLSNWRNNSPGSLIRLLRKNKTMSIERITVYHSKNSSRGFLGSIIMFCSDFWNARFVIWFLFKRDFIAQFRQKLFGYFWIVIAPFMAVLPFIFLTKVGLFRPGDTDMPYPIFIVIGLGYGV